jgi:IS30 family transposase
MKEYTKLELRDRFVIKLGIDNRESLSTIAKKLERSTSVVTREVAKNGGKLWYEPIKAHEKASISCKIGYSKIDSHMELRDYVVSKVKDGWSPVVIAGRWNMEKKSPSITAESIYEWIYSDKMKPQKLYLCLPRKKRKRGMVVRKTLVKDHDKQSISSRPDEVNQRLRIGDWEADLVFQKGNAGANFLTAVDRLSRFAHVIKHETKNAEVVGNSIKKIEQMYGVITLTLDNGSEFARYKTYNSSVYFCNPGSPWQKGAIEHFNGMLRRKIDYRIPLDSIAQEYIDEIVDKMNNTPRKILKFMTPAEVFKQSRNEAGPTGHGGHFNMKQECVASQT